MGKVVDKNDFWFIQKNPITKVGVFPYLGKQISEDCEPNKIYYVLRPKEELFKKETLDSLKLLPLVDEHTMLGKDFTPAEEKGIDGVLGEQVVHDNDTIYTDIKIYSEEMKDLIRNGKKELSLGYLCSYDKAEGTYKGQRYDYIQRNIIGNHLALVDKGRMGSDVRVYDQAIKEGMTMAMDSIDIEGEYKQNKGEDKMTELEKFLTGKISQDEMEEVKKIVEKEKEEEDEDDKKDDDKKEGKDKKSAKDKCGKDEDKDKKDDDKKEGEDEDKDKCEDEDDEKKDDDKKKEGEDEDEDKDDDKKKKDDKAMDEATFIKVFARKEKLGKEVEKLLGTFDHSEMTELEIAKYACDKLELGAEEGQEISTLKGYLKGVEKQKVEVKMKTEDSFNVVEDKSFDNYLKNAKK